MTGGELPATLLPAAASRFPSKARVVLGLQALEGVSDDDLAASLGDWHRRTALEWRPRGYSTRTGVRIAGSEPLLQSTIGARVEQEIAPLDGFAVVDVEDYDPTTRTLDTLLAPVQGMADALAGIVDPRRSFAMAGLVNLVLAGEGPVAMLLLCAHQPRVDLVDTHAWWCSFGDVVRGGVSSHMLGYHQVQCDPDLSRRAAASSGLATTGFELGDLLYLTDVESFVAADRAAAQGPPVDPGPPINQRDDFITFAGAVGAFCAVLAP